MTFVEWLGFFIAMVVLIISVVRRLAEERGRTEPPGKALETEEERRRAYREMLQSFGVEFEEEEPEPPPRHREASAVVAHKKSHRTPSNNFGIRSSIEGPRKISSVEHRHLRTSIQPKLASAQYGSRVAGDNLKVVLGTHTQRARPPKIKGWLKGLPSRRALIISHEIIGVPKGLQ